MKIHLKLFAQLKDIAGFEERTITLETPATTEVVFQHLVSNHPEFIRWKTYIRFAVNQQYVTEVTTLNDGDEVAIMPPVSGG